MENLFSYGTLQEDKVQRAVFGHPVAGTPDALVGYRLRVQVITDPRAIAISGRAEHAVLEPGGNETDQIEGTLFRLTAEELARADAYEDKAYKRVLVPMLSGVNAWVYVRA